MVSEVGYGVKWLLTILMHCTLIIEVILGVKTRSNTAAAAARVRQTLDPAQGVPARASPWTRFLGPKRLACAWTIGNPDWKWTVVYPVTHPSALSTLELHGNETLYREY